MSRWIKPAWWCWVSSVWVKLSNSGDILKPLIPNYSCKEYSGWNNYPCMVISQWMIEREIGYRGSKSIIKHLIPTSLSYIIVKEQRVDGSYTDNSVLRCTLMGFERSCRNLTGLLSNYESCQIKAPSNQKI